MSFRLSLHCRSIPDVSPRTPRLQEAYLHRTIHLEWTTLVVPTTSTNEPHQTTLTPSLALDEGCYPSFPYRPSYLSYPSCLSCPSFYPSSYPSSSQQELRNKTRECMRLQSSSEISEISDTSDTLMSETSETLISEISETLISDSSSEECWAFFPLAIILERC